MYVFVAIIIYKNNNAAVTSLFRSFLHAWHSNPQITHFSLSSEGRAWKVSTGVAMVPSSSGHKLFHTPSKYYINMRMITRQQSPAFYGPIKMQCCMVTWPKHGDALVDAHFLQKWKYKQKINKQLDIWSMRWRGIAYKHMPLNLQR